MHKTSSLAFYAIAIGLVLVLFKGVTVYGESRLQPPISINGNYQVTLDGSIPNCQQLKPLTLDIHQSGIYLNASLVKDTNHQQISPPLRGKFERQQVNLEGNIPAKILCEQILPITIQAKSTSPDSLTGKITISGKDLPHTSLAFSATLQK
jgi:hypothetical protein